MQNNHAPRNLTTYKTRVKATHAIYQVLLTGAEEASDITIKHSEEIDYDFYCKLVLGVKESLEQLKVKVEQYTGKSSDSINLINLAALCLGIFELTSLSQDTATVIISHYVKISYSFGTQYGYALVNGILDKIAKTNCQPV